MVQPTTDTAISTQPEWAEDICRDWYVHSSQPVLQLTPRSTAPLFETALRLQDPRYAVQYSCYLLVLVIHLTLGVPRRGTRLVLAGLKFIVSTALLVARGGPLDKNERKLVDDIFEDPRTVIQCFNLEPDLRPYVCCPECFALYEGPTCPDKCNSQETRSGPSCGANLWRTRRINGLDVRCPKGTYLHQGMQEWVGRLLCRPGIEALMRRTVLERKANGGTMSDIWDGEVLQSFLGPDGLGFTDAPDEEMRLVFSLAVDGFNPRGSKTAKQNVTTTGIYMVCLNLPPELRYLPENMYLVGLIPGPTKPSLSQINHILKLLVDDLLAFWEPGVFYSWTPEHQDGLLVRIACIPLVSDLPAARQVSGFASHSSKWMCGFCGLKTDDIENIDPRTWPPRDLQAHHCHAQAWLNAGSLDERNRLFAETGIRWTELLRLPYWNPINFTVIDSMHNLYLGLVQTHCRDIWGMSVDIEDGDATANPNHKAVQRPSQQDMAAGLYALYFGHKKSDLAKCRREILWHLCMDRDLRRAGDKEDLLKVLRQWVCRRISAIF